MNDDIVKLPLWRNALDAMQARGLSSGSVWPTEFFEEHLRMDRKHRGFSWGVSAVNGALNRLGYYLSARGQRGVQYVLLTQSQNLREHEAMNRRALRTTERAFVLIAATHREELTDHERALADKLEAKAAMRLCFLTKHQPPQELPRPPKRLE